MVAGHRARHRREDDDVTVSLEKGLFCRPAPATDRWSAFKDTGQKAPARSLKLPRSRRSRQWFIVGYRPFVGPSLIPTARRWGPLTPTRDSRKTVPRLTLLADRDLSLKVYAGAKAAPEIAKRLQRDFAIGGMSLASRHFARQIRSTRSWLTTRGFRHQGRPPKRARREHRPGQEVGGKPSLPSTTAQKNWKNLLPA